MYRTKTDEVKSEKEKIIKDYISIRKAKGISQKKLADMTGQQQPVIARMERGTDIYISTLLTSLHGLGYTLVIVPTFDQWLYEHGYINSYHNEARNTYRKNKFDREVTKEELYLNYLKERGLEVEML